MQGHRVIRTYLFDVFFSFSFSFSAFSNNCEIHFEMLDISSRYTNGNYFCFDERNEGDK